MDLPLHEAVSQADVSGLGSWADIAMAVLAVASLIVAIIALAQTSKSNKAADAAVRAASSANEIATGANSLATSANELAGKANGLASEANRVALSRAVYTERRALRDLLTFEYAKLGDTFETVLGSTYPRESDDAVSQAFIDRARQIGPGMAEAATWIVAVFSDFSVEMRQGSRMDDETPVLGIHDLLSDRLAGWMDGGVYDPLDTSPIRIDQLWDDGLPATTKSFVSGTESR